MQLKVKFRREPTRRSTSKYRPLAHKTNKVACYPIFVENRQSPSMNTRQKSLRKMISFKWLNLKSPKLDLLRTVIKKINKVIRSQMKHQRLERIIVTTTL